MMRSLSGLIIFLMLTSCAAEPETDSEQISPDQLPAASLAADGGSTHGLYRASDEKGVILIEELRPDGTYAFSEEDGEVIEEGTYQQKSQSELCFTADTEGATEKCYREAVGEDGVWRSIDPETNAVFVIERIGE